MAARSIPRTLALVVALLLLPGHAVSATPVPPAAGHGLMQGFPPAAEQRVTRETTMIAPFNRGAFQHIRELHPTRVVQRDAARVSALAAAPREFGGFSAADRARGYAAMHAEV